MSWVISEFLARDSVSLGQLSRSIENPEQDYYRPNAGLISSENIAQIRYEGFKETLERAEGSKLSAFLTNLFSVSRTGSDSTSSDIESAACITYQLKNSGDFFARLCQDPIAQEWLNRAFRFKKDVFLVVGIKTLTDAKVALRREQKKESEVSVELPVEEALLAAGVPVPPGIVGGVGTSAAADKSASANSQFLVPGEQIYAVQFRKLKFRIFARREVQNAYLEDGGTWKAYGGGRGDEEEDEDDEFMQVSLLDGETDLKLQHKFETMQMGEEEVVFVEKKK